MDDEDNIDPDKLEELKSCFGSFDNNGDGTISGMLRCHLLIIFTPAIILEIDPETCMLFLF